MADQDRGTAYDCEVLAVLIWEMLPTQKPDSERKLKRRLHEKRLGAYDQARIDTLREFKEYLVRELRLGRKSAFYRPDTGRYAKLEDWDIERLIRHLDDEHPDVPEATIRSMLPRAIDAYYLR